MSTCGWWLHTITPCLFNGGVRKKIPDQPDVNSLDKSHDIVHCSDIAPMLGRKFQLFLLLSLQKPNRQSESSEGPVWLSGWQWDHWCPEEGCDCVLMWKQWYQSRLSIGSGEHTERNRQHKSRRQRQQTHFGRQLQNLRSGTLSKWINMRFPMPLSVFVAVAAFHYGNRRLIIYFLDMQQTNIHSFLIRFQLSQPLWSLQRRRKCSLLMVSKCQCLYHLSKWWRHRKKYSQSSYFSRRWADQAPENRYLKTIFTAKVQILIGLTVSPSPIASNWCSSCFTVMWL